MLLIDQPSSRSLESPAIEILATNLFGIVHTGRRLIPNLQVTTFGTPNLNSYEHSKLFGKSIYGTSKNWVLVDSPGDELSFTGNTSTLTSFTMGAFIQTQYSGGNIWNVITIHSMPETGIESGGFRVTLYESGGYLGFREYYISSGNILKELIKTPTYLHGWHHVAVVYNAASRHLYLYRNGAFILNTTLNTEACCSNGGYLIHIHVYYSSILFGKGYKINMS